MATQNIFIRSLSKVNSIVEWTCTNLSWVMLFAITMLNIVQVFYRYVLNDALSWTEEASLWMLVWISFLILPVAYRKGLNISMMLFRDMLKRNRFEYFLRCLYHVIVLLIASVCLYQSWLMFKGGWRLELSALEVSKAWVYIVMPPAWFLLILALIEGFINDFPGIIDPETARKREDAKKPVVTEGEAI
jgi:TRAP-type C4-dicarboxylate transport system permease small subunit